jgi:hypothetical protein
MSVPSNQMQSSGQFAPITFGGAVNDANAGLGIYQGLQSGTPQGDIRAAGSAAKLAGNLSNNSTLSSAGGAGLDALGIYSGLQQGGWQGDTRAGASALGLAGILSNTPGLQQAAGYIAAPLDVYNFVNNWQSGKTGSNALNGAEAGAAVGSIIPGIGTLIGGVVGGAVGALSSAFGPGAKDPETADVQNVINAVSSNQNNPNVAASAQDPYLELAGLMDERSSTLPMYQQYGRMGEQAFTNAMTQKINQAVQQNPSLANNPQAVYNQVVSPWINQMGSGYQNVGQAYTATTQGLVQDMVNQYMSGNAAQDWKAVGGDEPFANIYQGSPFTAAPTPTPVSTGPIGSNRQTSRMAGGGGVSNLRSIYAGSFAKRRANKHHFDDGGQYLSYFNPQLPLNYTSADNPTLQDPTQSNVWNQSALDQYLNSSQGQGNVLNSSNTPYGTMNSGSGSSGSNPYSGIGSLLSGLGLSGQTAAGLAALAPLLASALGANKGASAPGTPSQYSGTLLNMQTAPQFNRTQNPINMSQQQWLHSAETGPEPQFYSNNQLPQTPMTPYSSASPPSSTSPYTGSQTNPYSVVLPSMFNQPQNPAPPQGQQQPPQQAPYMGGPNQMSIMPVNLGGGMRMAGGGLTSLGASFDSTGSGLGGLGHVKGPGDGTSDSIKLKNAYLSNGEYVIDAPTVSAYGNGSNDAGAKKLDAFRAGVRKKYGKHMASGKQPMNVNAYGGTLQ